MRIGAQYSHLNGLEYLLVHKPDLWGEIQEVIASVDAEACRTKVSKEKNMKGKLLYAPIEMNKAVKAGFDARDWQERRTSYWVTGNAKVIRKTMHLPSDQQKAEIEDAGETAISSYNQTDFVKERVAV